MHSLNELLEMSESEKEKYGVVYTPSEINHQSQVWMETAKILKSGNSEIKEFITKTGILENPKSSIIITGAGTSEFVGNSVASMLQQKLNISVNSVSTTDFITYPERFLLRGWTILLISVARSGDSPESKATYRKSKLTNPEVWQLVVTCNRNGSLAEEARRDKRSHLIVLPEDTNDKGLAMTSSFSSMVLSIISLGYLDDINKFSKLAGFTSTGAKKILEEKSELIRKFVQTDVERVQYLGSGELKGFAQEAHLKILEMTDGKVASSYNSYVGLRHGPQVFVNNNTLVIASLSGNSDTRRYELDLLKEMQNKKQGKNYLFICQKADDDISSLNGKVLEILPDERELILPDSFRVMTDIIVGQLAGLFKSLHLGLKPDSPSSSGTINRVVEGITIYGAGYDN